MAELMEADEERDGNDLAMQPYLSRFREADEEVLTGPDEAESQVEEVLECDEEKALREGSSRLSWKAKARLDAAKAKINEHRTVRKDYEMALAAEKDFGDLATRLAGVQIDCEKAATMAEPLATQAMCGKTRPTARSLPLSVRCWRSCAGASASAWSPFACWR